MPDPTSPTEINYWASLIVGVLGIAVTQIVKEYIIPWIKSWGYKKSTGEEEILVEGYGGEIAALAGKYNFVDRANLQPFFFEIKSGRIVKKDSSLTLQIDMINVHIDGQKAEAVAVAEGVLAGNFSYVIYTTTELPPARGKWTGAAVFRLSSSGESYGIWVIEDIYEPGKYMIGDVYIWPKGKAPRQSLKTPLPM